MRNSWIAKTIVCFVVVILLELLVGSCAAQDHSLQDPALQRIISNFRWAHFWLGHTSVDDFYKPGERVDMLLFRTDRSGVPSTGMCSPQLRACVAYFSPAAFFNMRINPDTAIEKSFSEFVESGFGGRSLFNHLQGKASAQDYKTKEVSLILPELGPPEVISDPARIEQLKREAQSTTEQLSCQLAGSSKCATTVVFAQRGQDDPYWYALRLCSQGCQAPQESVFALTRDEQGWIANSAGYYR